MKYVGSLESSLSDGFGNPLRVWQRYNRGGVKEIPLTDGPIKATAPDTEFGDIYVQGRIRKRDSHWVVTLFLINAQEEGRPKDESHIFQPTLKVEAVDGKPIFCKRMAVGSNDDLEEHLMAMLYRHTSEFAVGHGVSVHADVSTESSDLATLIRTEFVPRHELPRTAPPTENDADQKAAFGKLKGLVLPALMCVTTSSRCNDKNSSINRINEKLKAFDEWTAASIDKRQLMLIELAKDVWKTSLIE